MELKLEHLAGYLPYGLKVQYIGVLNGKEISKREKENQSDDFFGEPKTPHPSTEYGLKIGLLKKVEIYLNYWKIRVGNGHKNLYSSDFGSKAFLVLRPLSDLTKEIEVNGEKFVPLHRLLEESGFDLEKLPNDEILSYQGQFSDIDFIHYRDAETLFSWHFDLFNLIKNGLAIDVNTLSTLPNQQLTK